MLGISILLFRNYLEKWQIVMKEAQELTGTSASDVALYRANALESGYEFFGSSIWIIILAIIVSFILKWVLSGR